MIQTVWSQNSNGNILELNLRSSDREVGLLIFNLEGLGPPKATVNGSGGPNFDGIRVSSVGADARHLLITLAVVSGRPELEEEAKKKIYTYFPIKQEITFGIKTDAKDVYIPAIVESNEFNQFSKVENAVISLFCPNPYFIDVKEQQIILSGDLVTPLFEFPFESDSNYVYVFDTLEFGNITEGNPTAIVDYTGEVKTGVDIFLEMGGYVEDVAILNTNGDQIMTLDFSGAEAYFNDPVRAGDKVFINTRVGQKSIYFVRGITWFNIMAGVGINDDWLEIRPGSNTLMLEANVGLLDMEMEIRFKGLSEGV